MLDRPRIVKEGKEGEEEDDEEEDEDDDEELPSYLREQSSDEEHAALYSKNRLNANGEADFNSTLLTPFMSFLVISYRTLCCTLLCSSVL